MAGLQSLQPESVALWWTIMALVQFYVLCLHIWWDHHSPISPLTCLPRHTPCHLNNSYRKIKALRFEIDFVGNTVFQPVGLLPSSFCECHMCCTCTQWNLFSCSRKIRKKNHVNEAKARFKDDGKKRCPGWDSNPRPPACHCRCSTTELPRHIRCDSRKHTYTTRLTPLPL